NIAIKAGPLLGNEPRPWATALEYTDARPLKARQGHGVQITPVRTYRGHRRTFLAKSAQKIVQHGVGATHACRINEVGGHHYIGSVGVRAAGSLAPSRMLGLDTVVIAYVF